MVFVIDLRLEIRVRWRIPTHPSPRRCQRCGRGCRDGSSWSRHGEPLGVSRVHPVRRLANRARSLLGLEPTQVLLRLRRPSSRWHASSPPDLQEPRLRAADGPRASLSRVSRRSPYRAPDRSQRGAAGPLGDHQARPQGSPATDSFSDPPAVRMIVSHPRVFDDQKRPSVRPDRGSLRGTRQEEAVGSTSTWRPGQRIHG